MPAAAVDAHLQQGEISTQLSVLQQLVLFWSLRVTRWCAGVPESVSKVTALSGEAALYSCYSRGLFINT